MKSQQNPFSHVWSKLANVIKFRYFDRQQTRIQSLEEPETDAFEDENQYIHISDWVEPSVYFTIFCPHQWK
jgi:hypothetical protein